MSAIPQIDKPEEIGKAYQCMVQTYGKKVLKEPRRAKGAMADMAPKLVSEIKALDIALREKIPELLESDKSGKKAQTENAKRAVELLKGKGLTEEEAFSVVENLGEVLGIEMSIRPDYSRGGDIPYAPLPSGASLREAIDAMNHIRWFLNHENEYSWTGSRDSLTNLRRLLNYPKKNKQQIEELYKKIVLEFVNNPYENSFLLEDSKKKGGFSTDRFEAYFIVIDDKPVPVGFAKQYPGTDASQALSGFTKKKSQFLNKVSGLKSKFTRPQSRDAKNTIALRSAGRRFILFSIVFLAVLGYLARDIVLNIDPRPMFFMLKGYQYNIVKLIKAYESSRYAERYFAGCIIGAVMLLIIVFFLLCIIRTAMRCAKLKKAIGPSKKSDKAISVLEKEIPEKADAMEKSMKAYWNSKEKSLSLKKYDYRSVLKLETVSKVKVTDPVKKSAKRLRFLILVSCILLFFGNRSGFAADVISGSQLMGGVSPLTGNAGSGGSTAVGIGKVVASFTEADASELSGLGRANIVDCSQSSYLNSQSGADYTARSAMDQNDQTSWQIRQEDAGAEAAIWFALDQPYQVQYITLKLGNWRTAEYYEQNNRPESMTIQIGDMRADYVFPDEQREFVLKVDYPSIGSQVKFIVNSVYSGSQWSDTCITDVGIYGTPQAEAEAQPEAADEAGASAEAAVPEVQADEAAAQGGWTGKLTYDQQSGLLSAGTVLSQDTMVQYLMANTANRAVYVLDMERMQEYGVENSDTPMPASALIGVPILFTAASEVENGNIGINDPVTFSYTFQGGRGNLKSSQQGQTFSLREMLSEALLYSDNNAINSLIDFLGLDRINRVCHENGFKSVDMQRKLQSSSTNLENYISAKDAAMMLNAIYQNNYSEINRAFLEDNFYIRSTDTSNAGMYPVGSNYMEFLNLNGITDTRYNEVGLFADGDHAFIISILTCDGKADNSVSMVRDLSGYIAPVLMG